jgi:hypothetical protein
MEVCAAIGIAAEVISNAAAPVKKNERKGEVRSCAWLYIGVCSWQWDERSGL